jgi:P-type Ca2+ transporter type 2C
VHVLAIRSESKSLFRIGLFSNLPLLGALVLTLLLQLAVIYVSALNGIFRTEPLTWLGDGSLFPVAPGRVCCGRN